MNHSGSIFKKIASINKTGLTPILEGIENYKANSLEVERDALRRSEICQGCENIEPEPIDFLRVDDERIKPLANNICGGDTGCGCALPYLNRQYSKICKKWKE